MLDCCRLFFVLVMNYFIELSMNSPNLSTIQKPNCPQFPGLTMTGFADALRPDNFTGVHFKRWQLKSTLWLKRAPRLSRWSPLAILMGREIYLLFFQYHLLGALIRVLTCMCVCARALISLYSLLIRLHMILQF